MLEKVVNKGFCCETALEGIFDWNDYLVDIILFLLNLEYELWLVVILSPYIPYELTILSGEFGILLFWLCRYEGFWETAPVD